MAIFVFETDYPDLNADMADNLLDWSSETRLPNETSARALWIYTNIIRGKDIALFLHCIPRLSHRFNDVLSILVSLEMEMNEYAVEVDDRSEVFNPPIHNRKASLIDSMMSPHSRKPSFQAAVNSYSDKRRKSSWHELAMNALNSAKPDRKNVIKKSVCSVLDALLNLYKEILENIDVDPTNILDSNVFWISLTILQLPSGPFSGTYLIALEVCLLYLKLYGKIFRSNAASLETFMGKFDMLPRDFGGIQSIVASSIFDTSLDVSTRSLELLLVCWTTLPIIVIDKNSAGFMYTVMYTIVWIFSRLDDPTQHSTVKLIASNLKFILKKTDVDVFKNLINCLTDIGEESNTAVDELLSLATRDIFQAFVPQFSVNIKEFFTCAVQLGNSISKIVLKINNLIWLYAKVAYTDSTEFNEIVRPFKSFTRKLASILNESSEISSLTRAVLKEGDVVLDCITQIDVTSLGKHDTLPEMNLENVGSARTALKMLLDIGIIPLKR